MKMRNLTMLSIILLLSSTVRGQELGAEYVAESIVTPNFFIAVIAGVLLAMGFQFILTALSVAAGITAVGDLREKYIHHKYGLNKEHFDDDEDDEKDKDDSMSTGTMVTTGFGIWSVITASLSLFGATALAINLILIGNTVISITLGLVIWATFFILMFYLESKVVNSLVGGLINTATAGLRASGDAVKGMFTTSKEQQMKNVAEDTVNKIRKDFSASFDPHVINETIDEFFKKLDNTLPDYDQVKQDVQKIIEESNEQKAKNEERIQQKTSQSQGGGSSATKWMAINSVLTHAISETSRGGGDQDQSKTEQLKRLQRELKEAYSEGGTNEEKLEKVVSRMTPMEEEQVHSYIEKIKEVLSKATPNDMDQNQLQEKVMQVVKNPTVEGPKLASKLKEVDRRTIVDVLSKNTSLERNQVEKYADKVEQLLQKISGSMSGSGSTGDSSAFADLKRKLEREISKFTNGSGSGSGVNFASLTSLFQSKMDNQNESLQSVKYKLKNMDRDQLAAIVTSNTSLKQEHIDKVVTSIEDARNNVLDRVNKIEDTASRKLKNLQRKAVIEAENTRKNAAAAAWWVVASAVISAGAAIGGSLLALG